LKIVGSSTPKNQLPTLIDVFLSFDINDVIFGSFAYQVAMSQYIHLFFQAHHEFMIIDAV